jgi:hypothetical protein
MAALSFLSCVAQSLPDRLASLRVSEFNAALIGLLRNVQCDVVLAPGAKKPKNAGLIEVDGNRIRDFFTVLNLSTTRWYTISQIMSCHVFSMVRGWLDAVYCRGEAGEAADPLTVTVKDAIVEYCIRVLQQCSLNGIDDKYVDAGDRLMIQGAALEVIGIFDALCTADPSIIPRLLPEVKRLDKRCTEPGDAVVSLALMRFFINHREVVVYDLQPALVAHFGKTLLKMYEDHPLHFNHAPFPFTCIYLSSLVFRMHMPSFFLALFAIHPIPVFLPPFLRSRFIFGRHDRILLKNGTASFNLSLLLSVRSFAYPDDHVRLQI